MRPLAQGSGSYICIASSSQGKLRRPGRFLLPCYRTVKGSTIRSGNNSIIPGRSWGSYGASPTPPLDEDPDPSSQLLPTLPAAAGCGPGSLSIHSSTYFDPHRPHVVLFDTWWCSTASVHSARPRHIIPVSVTLVQIPQHRNRGAVTGSDT